jgi:hypothetical protein
MMPCITNRIQRHGSCSCPYCRAASADTPPHFTPPHGPVYGIPAWFGNTLGIKVARIPCFAASE